MRRYTPDSYHERLDREWFRNLPVRENWSQMPRRTTEERQQRYISDCERVTMTLLHRAVSEGKITHPLLRVWIVRYLSDTGYSAPLPNPQDVTVEEWARAARSRPGAVSEWVNEFRKKGFWVAEKRYQATGGRWYELTYPDEDIIFEESGDLGLALAQYHEDIDKAALHLIYALQEHRDRGEEGVETTAAVDGELAAATTLAAAIVEYHQQVLCATHRWFDTKGFLSS